MEPHALLCLASFAQRIFEMDPQMCAQYAPPLPSAFLPFTVLQQRFLAWGDFAPQGHLAVSRGSFGCHNWVGVPGIW